MNFLWVLRYWLPVCLLASMAASAAESPEIIRAKEAASHADWDVVLEVLTPFVAVNSNEVAWTLLADAQLQLGDTATAVDSYRKALAVDARYPSAVLALTNYYIVTSKLAEADAVVAAAEEKDKKGKFDEIKVARGQVMAKQGNMGEATQRIASASAKNPKNPLYSQILARVYADQKVWQLAVDNYAKAWELAPGDMQIGYEYALALQELKQYNEALDIFKIVQEKDPDNKFVDYLIGRLYYAAKRYGEAATQFKKSTEKRPDHFLSFMLLGRSYLEFSKAERKNLYAQSIAAFETAMNLKPDRADLRESLAEALFSDGKARYGVAQADSANKNPSKFDSTIITIKKALAINPNFPAANGQIAKAFDKQGNLDSARVYAAEEYRINPADKNEFARYVNILQRQKRDADLVVVLEPAIADSSLYDKYSLILVNSYLETKQQQEANELAEQAVARNPLNCNAHQVHAYTHLKREDYSGAIAPLLEGVKHCPDDADLWLQLGDCYYFSDSKSKSRVTQSRDAYRKACSLGNKDGCSKASQIEQILATLK